MKRIDASEKGIFEISWSPNGEWLTYVLGDDEVRLANVVTNEVRTIGKGRSPSLTKDMKVLLERDDEIVLVEGSGERILTGSKVFGGSSISELRGGKEVEGTGSKEV